MASDVPPAAEQRESLLAQYRKRSMWRLMVWGGAAMLSLAVAIVVSQTALGKRRLQTALSGAGQSDEARVGMATAPILPPSADLAAVKRATDRAAAKLAVVQRDTAATRAETKQLARKVSKLTADSLRFTGRLANIEQQVDGITGSIKQQAEKAAAAAVVKAMPPRPARDNAFDRPAPAISPPATTPPQLSLIMPPAPRSASSPLSADASKPTDEKTEDKGKPDVTTTASITTPESKPKDQSRVASKAEGTPAPETKQMAKAEEKPEELQPLPKAKQKIAEEPHGKPIVKPMAKAEAESKTAKPARAMVQSTVKVASAAQPTRRRYSRHWIPKRSYGIDLGGADTVTIVRAEWAAVKANFGPILAGMHPIAVRNHRFLTSGNYRLVVGRLRSRAAAERLCKRFARHQLACQPIEFDGERVVWR